jgi:hypothetical protein
VEKYFVCSNGDEPYCIRFTFESATSEGDTYIDVFDENGEKVSSWKKKESPPYTKHVVYTQNF